MTKNGSGDSWIVDPDSLPAKFPTHRHEGRFWESLGRAVGTFGYLEEVLGRAIYALSGTKPHDRTWARQLEKALTDPLGNLIEDYAKAVREHPDATTEDLDCLIDRLRKASKIRNVLCHGSWQAPDSQGASVPRFVDRKLNVFDTRVDCAFLDRVQQHVAELSCAVRNSVTRMGRQFPGSSGPGRPIV